MAKVTRWVCSACKAAWFAPQNGRCPSCGGSGSEKSVQLDADGNVVDAKTD